MKTKDIPDGKKVIGLSLSRCIRDILDGNIRFDKVAKIITGTHWRDEYEKGKVVGAYSETAWKMYPEGKAERYFLQLLREGKIEQSRLVNDMSPDIVDGHWVLDESEIKWKKDR